jgi:hypothetical protein
VDEKAPPELFGYIYDIPRTITVGDLMQAFRKELIDCQIQIVPCPAKKCDSAMVKFQNSVHL